MVNLNLKLFLICSLVVLASGLSSRNLPIISFDEGYSQLFGDDNLMLLQDGKSVHISLDERTGLLIFLTFDFLLFCYFLVRVVFKFVLVTCTGSGFVSQDVYLHGFFSASIKLPADYTAGVVVAFYVSVFF